jgi:hypothetical protein
MKNAKLISPDTIVLEDISRAIFIKEFLAIHELENKFAAGAISGPPFKMYWTGSVYGFFISSISSLDNCFTAVVKLAPLLLTMTVNFLLLWQPS